MKSRSLFPYLTLVFMQVVLTLLLSNSAGAAFLVSGVIQQDTTWSGEVNVVGDVVVNQNVTLTILPGTIIKFGTGAKTYDCWSLLFPGETKPEDWGTSKWLVVMGRLVAEGTADNFIKFTSAAATPTKGDWDCILFHKITGNSSLKYSLVEYGSDAINTAGDGNTNYTITIHNNVIRHSEEGILLSATGNADIQYNTIYNNNEGVEYHKSLEGLCKLVTLQNNIIVSNRDIGVNNSSRGCTYVSSYNDVWDNGLNYDQGYGDPVASPIINTSDISVDPKFVQYPDDLHLQITSPCLTASDQGGRIGAYGYVPTLIDLNKGLVAYYPLDGSANDSAGSNDGTEHDGVSYSSGLSGQAASFDGVDDYIELLDLSSTFLVGAPITISLWVKSESDVGGYIVGGDPGGGPDFALGHHMYPTGSQGLYAMAYGNTPQLITNEPVEQNRWYHVAYGLDASGSFIYVDGQLKDTSPIRSLYNRDKLTIGRRVLGIPHYPFNGLVDDVRIYNRALSTTEVAQLATERPDGDIDQDGILTLTDMLLSLQISSGYQTEGNITTKGDINEDQKIGIEESIYIITKLSESSPENIYEIKEIIVNGNTSYAFNQNTVVSLYTNDVFQFKGTATANSSVLLTLEDPILMQSLQVTVHTDSQGVFYYPEEYIHAASTHVIPQNSTFIYLFAQGQGIAITSNALEAETNDVIDIISMKYVGIGGSAPLEQIELDPDLSCIMRYNQDTNNGGTITTHDMDCVNRGRVKMEKFAEDDILTLVNENKYDIAYNVIIYGAQAVSCGGALGLTGATAGVSTPVAVAACTPIVLHATRDISHVYIDHQVSTGKMDEDAGELYKGASTIIYATTSFAIAGDPNSAIETVDFAKDMIEGGAGLISATKEESNGNEYIRAIFNDNGYEKTVLMIPYKEFTVTSEDQTWMGRNLGASRIATSATDTEAYGDLYQ